MVVLKRLGTLDRLRHETVSSVHVATIFQSVIH